ncbi:hypothetical protein NBRC10512_005279 [Rhodotorula toruloides]|uniref:RHTO0S23e01266g1_1 n=2 Tax=Rhodotorula toruloides TaxID=5286 RepID=A0A061BGM2_RHOTO|nr:dihydrofolate reductase [Rhodotorula toruloides NP11]EMS18494.1 dihydrofolate reductase [Rhodotorula toruloides NP11]CDR49130.1 RHTO0S23e01266g1_1 [Rhodotorula toruloides]
MLATNQKIRVLGLPGHAQSAKLLEGKLARHMHIWGDDIELVTMDPAYSLLMPTLDSSDFTELLNPAFSWWDWSTHYKYKPGEFEGALRHLRQFMEENGPFDAVFSFSQGAAMAVLLLALLENPDLHPAWTAGPSKEGVEWPPAPLKCAVLCSAFGPLDPDFARWFFGRRPIIPTLHVIGKNDVVADPQLSLDTVARFADARVVWHDGGHHIPRKPYYAHLIKEFILSSCEMHDWRVDEEQGGWGTPTESVSSSVGEGNEYFPAMPLVAEDVVAHF